MGFFDKVFGKAKEIKDSQGYFKMLNGYTPVFTTWNGGIYESELCRTAIDSIARQCSKLQISLTGEAKQSLRTQLKQSPNGFQSWSQFLYRISTILYVNNTAFIVPILSDVGQVVGIYPIAPQAWELVQVNGEAWLRFRFANGQNTAIELSRVGILTRFQFQSDMFGENNSALRDTMNLIKIQRQGIEESAKNSASYRFMARINNFAMDSKLKQERERFDQNNFQTNGGGLLLFPNTYTDIKQISQQTYAIDSKQMELIQDNVFNYYGVNKDVIQNKAYGDAWSAFYEGVIEPFAIQLSEVLTRMFFTGREMANKNSVFFTANRLQYMTNADKLAVSTDMIDRGLLSLNEAREIWNLPPIDGGDAHIIRGEYYNTDEKISDQEESTDE